MPEFLRIYEYAFPKRHKCKRQLKKPTGFEPLFAAFPQSVASALFDFLSDFKGARFIYFREMR